VDDHQMRFSAHMRDNGRITLAGDRTAFEALVARAITHPAEFVVGPEDSPTAATAARVEAALLELVPEPGLVDLVPQPRRRLLLGRRTGRTAPAPVDRQAVS
jgi:hypothetical protein